jgi:lipopolysaccharide transport system permease protein
MAAASALPRRVEYGRDLLRELVVRDLKLRYKRSYLGVGWTLVNPLAQLLVFDFVFRVLFRVDTPNFSSFLFIGIVAWNWFSGALLQATTAIVDNKDLIRQPGFPAGMLPIVSIGSHFIHYLLTLPIVFVLLWVSEIPTAVSVAWLPSIIVLQFAFTLALGYFVAFIHVTFRDTQYLLGIFLMLGFFMTPILYTVDLVPESYLFIYEFNPMAHLVAAYRDVMMHGTNPNFMSLGAVTGASIIGLWISHRLFQKASTRFAEEI